MYIKKIQLVNIGSYRHKNTFHLTTTDKKNVILIGGKNGSGKTTFLNALKLGLFGAYSFGYKTENNDYLSDVARILNNEAKRLREDDFSITIDFDITDNLVTHNYQLIRTWTMTNHLPKETMRLFKNKQELSKVEIEYFRSKLKELMPPQLLEFSMFDGEKISNILSGRQLAQYIKKLSKFVFNLDIFESLERDLELYTNQQIDKNKISALERDLLTTKEQLKIKRAQRSEHSQQLEELEEKRNLVQEEYYIAKQDFEQFGGLKKDVREQYLKEIAKLETQREQRILEIKEFISTLLPFFLVKPLLEETRQQIKNEESIQLAVQLDKRLSVDTMTQLFNSHVLDKQSGINPDAIDSFKKALLQEIAPDFHHHMIHNASLMDSLKISQVHNLTQQPLLERHRQMIEQNKRDLKQLRLLKTKVKTHDSTAEFKDLIDKMNQLQYELISIEHKIEQCHHKLESITQDLHEIIIKHEKIDSELRSLQKTSSSILEAQKIISLSIKFRELQTMQKLQDVQVRTTQYLGGMMQKSSYISKVQIDPETYEISLLDIKGYPLDKGLISAGEQQILLMALIWAIFDISGKISPFVFDTLLGRLDQTHKATILGHFIPRFGRQTIILSTDSEIDGAYYQILYPFVAQSYTLSFDQEKQSTHIAQGYFDFKGV